MAKSSGTTRAGSSASAAPSQSSALNAFTSYFQWKNKEISTDQWRAIPISEIRAMQRKASSIADEEFERNGRSELYRTLVNIDEELTDVITIRGGR